MKYIKGYKIFEGRLTIDTNDIDDILIDVMEMGFEYNVEASWYSSDTIDEDRVSSVKVVIWKRGSSIYYSDIEKMSEDLYRLRDFMKQNGYVVNTTHPPMLLKDSSKSRVSVAFVEMLFKTYSDI